MRVPALIVILTLAAACTWSGDRERELADCINIYRSTYIAGQVRDCLIQRYRWSEEAADEADRERLRDTHPDSASRGDSGRMGDSAR